MKRSIFLVLVGAILTCALFATYSFTTKEKANPWVKAVVNPVVFTRQGLHACTGASEIHWIDSSYKAGDVISENGLYFKVIRMAGNENIECVEGQMRTPSRGGAVAKRLIHKTGRAARYYSRR